MSAQREDADSFVASEPSAKPIGARLGVLPPGPGAPLIGSLGQKRGADEMGKGAPGERGWDDGQHTPAERFTRRERERPQEPKSLDELFEKTKAKPEIYWKANSPEVAGIILQRMRGSPRGVPLPPPPNPPPIR